MTFNSIDDKPLFEATDFKSLEISSHGADNCARIANAKLHEWLKEASFDCPKCGNYVHCHECSERALIEASASLMRPKPGEGA